MAPLRRLLAEAPSGHHHKQGGAPSDWSAGYLNGWLSQQTPVFGLRLWVLIGIAVGAAIVLVLLLIFVCLSRRRRRRDEVLAANLYPADTKLLKQHLQQQATPTKDIREIVRRQHQPQTPPPAPQPAVQLAKAEPPVTPPPPHRAQQAPVVPAPPARKTPGSGMSATTSGWFVGLKNFQIAIIMTSLSVCPPPFDSSRFLWHKFEYGTVFKDYFCFILLIKFSFVYCFTRGQAEKEFKVEVEAIGRVRHKNLVRLLGYCVEGAYRMLVYEYVDNGNLDQWLHGDVGEVSPLTWDIRMNIMLATAKGLAYLHEGLEPKVVHRDIKASNILLDQQWNAKVSDFGLAKLLCSEESYVTTRVMGTFGYVAPEYASTGMLNERSDVYSFGVLIMEIITGRSPVDYTRAAGEVNLVEWLKTMVAERKAEEVVDPKMAEKPSPKALKRALLVALRCVDPDANKRPKMGHVIHMLEMDDLLFRDVCLNP
ncbi:hypothetical protein HU200_001832 [Digitaria exilis]|uniref:non-specific serine/threonine protein kinase n=1 Tax=Digitaria exilis TaxID=1010633 RepID=A0A835FY50_9POAL|nr:hypothetical protein HU200_001832 [Digitaria exilis]